jgi:hypothetical protein
LAFAADFNDLDMALHIIRAGAACESVALTMPCLGLKSDGRDGRALTARAGLCDLKSDKALAYQGT